MIEWGDEVVTCSIGDFKLEAAELIPEGFGKDCVVGETKILFVAADTIAEKNGYSFVQVVMPAHNPAVLVFRKLKTPD